ncbi:hypothetical protein HYW58_01660 [Candidatus Kaiserbacteria bacterium]|nr:hypothetical protein [Candidatus Kaiserbacteria bacterium]
MHTHRHSLPFSAVVLVIGCIVALFIVAAPLYAQESTIVFPVGELGNCENKEDCRDYCDNPLHMRACVAFAQAHNLISDEEAELAEKFSDSLGEGGGPGGCTTPSSCQSYCENITHLNECLAFADTHGHVDEHIEDGRKIANYLSEGGLMPGGCTSRESCETYCNDFNHAEECFLFAERVGLDIDEDEDGPERVDREHFRAMIELVKRGETPGGCTSRESCETYCGVSEHTEECVTFGEKVGFISHEEADIVRKTGGKGPGGCTSRDACETYCNNPANRDMCFAFAKEHGLIKESELRDIEEGVTRLREVLDTAPPEVAQCLKHNLGDNIVDNIRSGAILPGPDVADKARACLEKGFRERDEREFKGMVEDMPREVRSCIEEKLGSDIQDAFIVGGDHDKLEETVKSCFESFQPSSGEDFDDSRRFDGESSFDRPPSREGVGNFSPDMEACARRQFGDDFKEKLLSGELRAQDIGFAVERCVRERAQMGEFHNIPEEGNFQEFPNRDSGNVEDVQREFESLNREQNESIEFHIEDGRSFETFKEEPPADTRIDFTSGSEGESNVREFETTTGVEGQSSLLPGNNTLGAVINAVRQLLAP